MRDRLMGMLLSVLLSSLSFGEVTNGPESTPIDSLIAPVATLDSDASDTVLDDDGVEVKRLRPVTLANLTQQTPAAEKPFDRRPTIWTLHHHDMTPLLVAGLWPLHPDVARLALSAESEQKPLKHDVEAMLRVALSQCYTQGYLKLYVHAPSELAPNRRMVEALGFKHSRTVERRGTTIDSYYRNLYQSPFDSVDAIS